MDGSGGKTASVTQPQETISLSEKLDLVGALVCLLERISQWVKTEKRADTEAILLYSGWNYRLILFKNEVFVFERVLANSVKKRRPSLPRPVKELLSKQL